MPKVTQMPASSLPSPASAYQIFELKCVAKLKQTTAAKGDGGKGKSEREEGRRAAKWQFEDSRDSRQKAKGTKTN